MRNEMLSKVKSNYKTLPVDGLANKGHITFTAVTVCIILSLLILASCGGGGGSNGNIMDNDAPSVPAGLALTVVSSNQIDLNWIASSDNVGISGYRIYRDNVEDSTTSSVSYSNIGLVASTIYCYDISAYDASGNESAPSSQSCATTDSIPSSWSVSTIDSQGDVGLSTSISTGSVHISYYDSTNNQLKYIGNNSGTWDTPVSLISMGSISLETTFSAVSLDSIGNLYISYYDATSLLNGDLGMITCAAASDCSDAANWSNLLIDISGDVGSDTSMNIDLLDNIHISYYDSDNGYLKYASCLSANNCDQDSSWTKSIIDSSVDVGQYSSITTDSGNNIHISYYDSTGLFIGNLKYAFCSSLNDCTVPANWNITVIENSGDVGQYSSIASDSNNNIHISYYDAGNGNLKYASCLISTDCNQTSNWSTITIDNAVDVGDYSSIAIDSQDNLHISYHDFNNDRLKYATCTSTVDCTQSINWEISIVDGTSNVGEFSSIATDENDNVHISYYDSNNEDLKYAVKQ